MKRSTPGWTIISVIETPEYCNYNVVISQLHLFVGLGRLKIAVDFGGVRFLPPVLQEEIVVAARNVLSRGGQFALIQPTPPMRALLSDLNVTICSRVEDLNERPAQQVG